MVIITIRTNIGNVEFTGKLDKNSEYIFSFGYCANFAKILHDNCNDMKLAYIETNNEIDHLFCIFNDGHIYDILGKHSVNDFYDTYNYSIDSSIGILSSYDDIRFQKLYRVNYDIYAKIIIKEYIEKWNLHNVKN